MKNWYCDVWKFLFKIPAINIQFSIINNWLLICFFEFIYKLKRYSLISKLSGIEAYYKTHLINCLFNSYSNLRKIIFSISVFSVFEYIVVLSNMGYHSTSYYDFHDISITLGKFLFSLFHYLNLSWKVWNLYFALERGNVYSKKKIFVVYENASGIFLH